jgi:hypothetical protein
MYERVKTLMSWSEQYLTSESWTPSTQSVTLTEISWPDLVNLWSVQLTVIMPEPDTSIWPDPALKSLM